MKKVEIRLERISVQGFNWQARWIDDVEIPEWQKGRSYPTLEMYCEEQAKKEGWKSAAINCGKDDATITFW